MIEKIKVKYIKEIQYCLFAGFISLLVAYFFLGLKGVDLNVPFSYSGDVFGGLTAAQNFITGNGRYLYPNMGAPANSPDVSNLEYFSMWILSFFIEEAGLLINIFYILTYIIIAITTTVSLRLIKIQPITSIIGGVLYSLLPYHFSRGEGHLMLSTYAMVPLACVIILWVINGELNFNKENVETGSKNKFIFAILLAVFFGMTNSYYSFFACLGISFSIIWNYLEEKNINKVLASAVVLFSLVLTVIINLFPLFISLLNGTEFGLTGTRDVSDVERYSLRFIQLLLPVSGHRIPLLAEIKNFYENRISTFSNESGSSSLGFLFSIGLVISLFIAMRKNKNTEENISIKHSAVLNIFILILGSIGGISSLIAFIIPFIRCYNRLSIFIAFYSLYIVVYYIDSFLTKREIRNIIKVIIIAIIGVLSVFDMVGVNRTVGDKNKDKYYTHKEFVKRIEEITPAKSMVFQLPFVPSGHYGNFVNMYAYEQFFPFIHSSSLKWSYRAQLNSPAERWQDIIARKSVEEMLKHLAGVGFKGLYVDTRGYADEEYKKLRADIIKISGIKPIISNDKKMEYYYFGEYFEKLKKTFNEMEKKRYENWKSVHTIISNYDSVFDVSNSFYGILLSGWNNAESWGVWSEGNTAKIQFAVLEKSDFVLDMVFDVYNSPTYFSIDVNGITVDNFSLWGNNKLQIPINKDYLKNENGVFPVIIQFNIDNPRDSVVNDPRKIGIGIHRFSILRNE